jgi:hypothetical protein
MPAASDYQSALAEDDKLSNRSIELDPGGYFLIYLAGGQICADHYSNTINDQGVACDPETGEPLPCDQPLGRSPSRQYLAPTAKQLSIALFEQSGPSPVTRLDHAAYLGREFQKAEAALYQNHPYIQD